MPICNNPAYSLAELPSEEALKALEDDKVFYIPYTGEIFTSYQEYYDRIVLYRQKIWTCEMTNKQNLTYKAALESERKTTAKLDAKFPPVWIKPTLELIHFNRLSLNDLVDHIYDYFRGTRFVNEYVYIDVPTAGAERSVEKAIILEKLDQSVPVTLEKKVGDKRQMQREAREAREDNSRVPDDPHHYRIQLCSAPSKEYIVLPGQMRRGRQQLSKQTFKKYVKEVATKDKWVGSPWHVKPSLVIKYGLPSEPPENFGIKQKYDDELGKRGKRRPMDLYNSPIEDTELFDPQYAKKLDNPPPERPKLGIDFGGVSPDNAFNLIRVYTFITVYGKPLRVYPFKFHDFIAALSYNEADPPCDLICEVFASLLHVACGEYHSKYDYVNNTNPLFYGVPELNEEGKYSDDASENELITLLNTHYKSFNDSEKVGVDQWFKWRAGQWGVPAKKPKKGSKFIINYSSAENLKAWSVALFGFVKDCFKSKVPNTKWQILLKLLSPKTEKPIEPEESMDVDTPVDAEMSGTTNEEEVDELAEEEEDTSKVQKTPKKRKTIELSDEEEEEWEPEKAPKSNRSTRSTRSQPEKRTPSKTPKSKKKATPKTKAPPKSKKKMAQLGFEELCTKTELGFLTLNADEKIEILAFLVDELIPDCDQIRVYRDEAFEKITELKKEQRELVRTRKQNAAALAEFIKANPQLAENGNVEAPHVETDEIENNSDNNDSDNELNPIRSARIRRKMKVEKEKKVEQAQEIELTDEQQKLKKQQEEMEEKDRMYCRREEIIEFELRATQAIIRSKPLGRDRFCNRYWWFDGGYGMVSLDAVTKFPVSDRGNMPADPEILHEYSTGYLFVEEFFGSETDEKLNPGLYYHQSELRTGLLDGQWGYYSEPAQIEQLMAWLDTRGIRESILHHNLEYYQDVIFDGMEKRRNATAAQDVKEENDEEKNVTVQDHTIPDFLDYINAWAK
ncbi:hypothetical protein HDV04_003629 [Boothiomyces sp. JEL0838]|nr:hypothetical protein HDV04_003629 [Boothiomyces sp. JEL0838]